VSTAYFGEADHAVCSKAIRYFADARADAEARQLEEPREPAILARGLHGRSTSSEIRTQCLGEQTVACPARGEPNRLKLLAIKFEAQCGVCRAAILAQTGAEWSGEEP
jgi:hypothetical protein